MKKSKEIRTLCNVCDVGIKNDQVYYVNNINLLPVPVCSLGCYDKAVESLLKNKFLDMLEDTMGIGGMVSPMSPNFNGKIMLD